MVAVLFPKATGPRKPEWDLVFVIKIDSESFYKIICNVEANLKLQGYEHYRELTVQGKRATTYVEGLTVLHGPDTCENK